MNCEITTSIRVQLDLDIQGFGALERALAFYRDHGNVPDGDPVRDLSLKFTSMLIKLNLNQGQAPVAAPSTEVVASPVLPVPSGGSQCLLDKIIPGGQGGVNGA